MKYDNKQLYYCLLDIFPTTSTDEDIEYMSRVPYSNAIGSLMGPSQKKPFLTLGKWKTTCPTGTPKQATAERVTWPACDVLSVLLEAMSTKGPRCWKYAQEALIKLFIIIFHVYDNCLLSML